MAIGGGGGSGGASGSIRAGKAHVEMSARDAGLRSALDAIRARVLLVAKAAAIASAAMLGIGAIIGVQVVKSIGAVVEHFDNIKKAADRLTTTTEIISELGYAADASGSNIQEMEAAAKNLQRNLENNAEAFEKFGLSAEHLKTMDLGGQMEAVAEAISKMGDPSQKTAAAMELLGKSGTRLLPLFKNGAAGIRELREEAQGLGRSVNGEQAANAERIGDAMSRAWAGVKSILLSVGEAFLGNVENVEVFSKAIVLAAKEARGMLQQVIGMLPVLDSGFADTWKGIKDAINGGDLKLAFAIAFQSIEVSWREMVVEATDIWNDFKGVVVDGFHEIVTEVAVMTAKVLKELQDMMTKLGNSRLGRAVKAAGTLASPIAGALANAAGDLDLPSEEQIRRSAERDRLDRKAARNDDLREAREELAKAKADLEAMKNAAAKLVTKEGSNVVLATALALGEFARRGAMMALKNAPGASLGASETRGSFSTAAAQQALGVGGMSDKIEKNTRRAADGIDGVNKRLNDLQFEWGA